MFLVGSSSVIWVQQAIRLAHIFILNCDTMARLSTHTALDYKDIGTVETRPDFSAKKAETNGEFPVLSSGHDPGRQTRL